MSEILTDCVRGVKGVGALDVRVNQLVIDESLQPRVDGLDSDHVRTLMEAADSWPPLAVVTRADHYLLVDGFHRLAAAQNLGRETVSVEVVAGPADGDLHALAFYLNSRHGRPLSLADRRAFAARLLHQHPEWADREIARQSGLSGVTVAKVRGSLAQSGQIEDPAVRVGARGYTYPAPVLARPLGGLPGTGLGEAMGQLFTRGERRAQRQVADYVRRLTVALDDGADVAAWEDATRAAEACFAVLGPDRCERLAAVLGPHGVHLYRVARGLGWTPDAAS